MNTKLKRRRLELGLTLEAVGDIVGVGKSTVRKWESGEIENMKRDKIMLLAKALHVSPLFIMQEDLESSLLDDIHTTISKLDKKNQEDVYEYAEMKLHKQNETKIIELPNQEEIKEAKKSVQKATKEEREINKEVAQMMEQFGYAAYEGKDLEDMNDEDRELMEAAFRHAVTNARRIAKEKFTPNKYKK